MASDQGPGEFGNWKLSKNMFRCIFSLQVFEWSSDSEMVVFCKCTKTLITIMILFYSLPFWWLEAKHIVTIAVSFIVMVTFSHAYK